MEYKAGTQIPSSTGGTITYTKTGLIHSAGKSYSGEAPDLPTQSDVPRKRGRPAGSKNR